MSGKQWILCTGGLGYIGSHTVLQLLNQGYCVAIVDSLQNASEKVVTRLQELAPPNSQMEFKKVDLRNRQEVFKVFEERKYDAVIHYAGLKAVGESVRCPIEYYDNNITGTLHLLQAMETHKCYCMVFSSSATVYKPKETLINEDDPLGAFNPYGQTKLMIEQILQDLFISNQQWKISILRYFNPLGAHESGRIGESPREPTNLLPVIQHVAIGKRPFLHVYGNDWNTCDGTGVRDYIHVEDLASGHLAALSKILKMDNGAVCVYNLGRGKGLSVLQLKDVFEQVNKTPIAFEIAPRRPGDLAFVVADPSKAERELGWKATRTIEDACMSAWKWQSQNPDGY